MSSARTIAKNAGFLLASQLITWALALILAIFLPRYLGPEIMGEISIANAIWLIMTVLITFGMDLHLTKMVAREPHRASALMGTSLSIRIVFSLIACVLVGLYVTIMGYGARATLIIVILGVSYLLTTLSSTLNAVLTGLERMGSLSATTIITKTILTVASVLLILLDVSVYPIVALNIVASIVGIGILLYVFPREHPIRLQFNWSDAWAMIQTSKQYLVTALVLVAYQQIDKLFIVAMVDTRTVGWYGTAMGLFGTLMFIPGIFGTAVFPALARSYADGDDKTNIIARRGLDLMFLVSVPIGLGLLVISRPLILLLYGEEFLPSGAILGMLGVVLIFTYLNTFLGQLLISSDRTGPWNTVMLCAVLLTVPLDLILVPWTRDTFGNGALGGVTAFLFTEAIMVFGAVLLLPKGTLHWSNVRTGALTLVCGLLMVASTWWWREQMMFLAIIVGAAVYCAAVLLLRVISREDLLLLRDACGMLIGRLRRGKQAPVGAGD
ncbi:MAG: flippase [Chloroflexi bacterium OHK40]